MAIQHRRGIYDRFDPNQLVAGEWAIVLTGDPNASDGRAAYICFTAGQVKRVATFEDAVEIIANANAQIIADLTEGVDEAVGSAEDAASAATAAAASVGQAISAADASAAAADNAAASARSAASSASDAAAAAASAASAAGSAADDAGAQADAAEAAAAAANAAASESASMRAQVETAIGQAQTAASDAAGSASLASSAADAANAAAGAASSAAEDAADAAETATASAAGADAAAAAATAAAANATTAAGSASSAATEATAAAGQASDAADAATAAAADASDAADEASDAAGSAQTRIDYIDQLAPTLVSDNERRNADQARNNADQAANNQAAMSFYAVVLEEGEYDPVTLKPTAASGDAGKIYLVPNETAPDDGFIEWMWLNNDWERLGSTTTTITPITTSEIDAVASDSSPQGNEVMNLTGLSYFWAKLKAMLNAGYAALRHTHSFSDIVSGMLAVATGGTGRSSNTANSVLVGNGTDPIKNVASASGAFYSTGSGALPAFGTLPVAQGGTGAATASAALTALGAAAESHVHDAADVSSGTLSSDRLPTVPVTKGGTGATTATGARTNLEITPANIGAAASSHSHAYLPTSGGTATGDIRIKSANVNRDGANPSSTASGKSFLLYDNDSERVAIVRVDQYTDGGINLGIGAFSEKADGTEVPNWLNIKSNKNGTRAITVTDASAWRTGLGITPANIGAAAASHEHAASDVSSGTLDAARLPTITASKGGTGRTTLTSNAVLAGNGTGQVKQIATASGALYATSANGAAQFGALPVAQGGTGSTSAADARTALGVTAANIGLGNVGDTLENVLEAVSLPSNNNSTILGTLSVPKGVWIIKGIVSFAANSTGDRKVYIGTGTTLANTRNACNSAHAISTTQVVEEVATATLTGTKTYNLIAYQNSGSALNVSGMITAVRIK